MNCLITGGNDGVGKEIVDYFPGSFGVSRRNGYDISKESDRIKILEKSLDYDIFINLAYDGYLNQVKLLLEIFDKWLLEKKEGYIFNIGSYSTYCITKEFKRYNVLKYTLDQTSYQCSKFLENSFSTPFRVTLIRPGMLDIEKSRNKSYWRGIGIKGSHLANLIEYLYNTPKEIQVADIVLEIRKDIK